MCGILGAVNQDIDHSILDLIRHRGPDFAQICRYNTQFAEVTLAHSRLAILDLAETGNQPMTTRDNNYSIIFNGEIFNHLDLRASMSDVMFKGHSDTETILHYLAKNGIDGLKDFNGNFAFGFLDVKAQKLYLARDPFGVKPLYYHHDGHRLIFSSEIRPILAMVKATLNKAALGEVLKLRYNPAEDTLYNEIKKVKPGHYIVYDLVNESLELNSFLKPLGPKRTINFQQAVHQYGDLFEQAVRRQLMGDVEIGTLLSGGVDSALVTYFAAKNCKSKIKTFTVGFEDNDDANELNEARLSASILGTEHHEVVINQQDFGAVLEDVVRIVEEPLGTTSSIPMYFLNREVSNHVKVVLTGQGADEPLGGYTRYKGEIYRKYFPPVLSRMLSPMASHIKNEKIRRFLQSSGTSDIVSRFEKTYALFDDASIFRLTGLKDNLSITKIDYFYQLIQANHRSPVEAMMAIDKHLNLADDLMIYTDKVSMHFGVETRVPILDFDLVTFIESLPFKYKIHNSSGKHIHKEFARQVLPDTIVNRPKKGFKSPTDKWFEQDLGSLLEAMTKDSTNSFNLWFDTNEVKKILHLHQKGFNQEKQLFLLISLYFWFKNATL
jgi:asparagine synthase (glutamine-hydrolysing)